MKLLRYLGLCCLLCLCVETLCADARPVYAFTTAEQQQDFEYLTQTLRCLVCQNQSLADSQAPMASDLKRYIAKHLQQGEDVVQIKAQLLARYGEYLSFAPRWHARTSVLWLLPAVLMLWVVVMMLFRLARVTRAVPTNEGES